MKKNMYVVLAILFTLVSCDKTKDPVATVKNQIQVKVYNTKTWNIQTNKMDTVVGATVYLMSDSTTVSATTNNQGLATFSNVKEKGYSILSTKDDLSNIINKENINNRVVGYLIIGVYKSQEDINLFAQNPDAVVGGPKLYDIKGDGIIRINDKVSGMMEDFKYKYKDINNDGVIDVFDIVDGNLMKLDNLVKVSVFIGK